MGWRANLGLIVVVGGLGGYLYLNQETEPVAPVDPGQVGEKLVPKGTWIARHLRFQHAKTRQPVHFQFDMIGQDFRITEPVLDVASFAMLDSILSTYTTGMMLPCYSAEELAADPSLWKKTGLDEPAGFIEFRYDDGSRRRIEFGSLGVRENEMFVKVGDAIYLTDPVIRRKLDRNPDDFREHVVFTELAIGAPTKVRFEHRVGDRVEVHEVVATTEGYRLTEPVACRAARGQVAQFLRALGGLRVTRFLSGGTQERAPGETFDYTIAITGQRGSEILRIRSHPGGTLSAHLDNRNVNFELTQRSLDAAEQWFPTLRQRRVVTLEEAAIQRIELDPPGKGETGIFVRTANQGFRIDAPVKAAKSNATPIAELLHAVTRLDATGFLDEPGPDTGVGPADDPFTVRLGITREIARAVSVHFGTTNAEGMVHVRRGDETAVALIPEALVRPIRRPWIDFVSPYAPPLTINAFRVEATAPGQIEPRAYVFEELEWRRAGTEEVQPDIGSFVDALKTLRAAAVVPAESLDPDAKAVLVVLRRDVQPTSGEIFRLRLRRVGDQVFLQVVGYEDLAYRVDLPSFRKLTDLWL